MTQCAALAELQGGRDLWLLPEIADEVAWVAHDVLATSDQVAVVTGIWVANHLEEARTLISARSAADRTTLVLPNFLRGDLGPVLSAPATVEIRPGDADKVVWSDGDSYAVPSVCQLYTSLHAGRWASAGDGAAVLSHRPSTGHGLTVICTAAVASRAPGVRRQEQRRLAERIFSAIATEGPRRAQEPAESPTSVAPDLDAFLAESGPNAALLLLSLLACGGDRSADLARAAGERLGVRIEPEGFAPLIARLPPADANQIEAALRRHGWSAYLRRVTRGRPDSGDTR